ncbi:(2Fe-2S) ferredoxin domain-containing protein [Chromobacterium violaceum]|uniref:(2Fe-2S) ferredoxin domain-containing protein n=1 Tax=Chromobacterium violaceum TaxID=536 RepID=UPI0009D9BA86|nr:ferredoxin [Chromobacterium violaceum]MBT2867086.1 ferredoxin [Chromobacterium violaceum]MBX9267577.1 ferredoxin [Chromobacterium violaceum]OQS11957.1 ferredoxin [Chromobacterium violaceum]OQS21226.1 ferredoxin [Chromobacterium violaceum]OQS21722.1 ferredoxin [Chromobacterium violaceum]
MRTHDKHVLMCTGPRCTPGGEGSEAMFLHLGRAIDACDGLRAKRTRSHCFAVCKEGPVMVVYPDGVWYRKVSETDIERIVCQHLKGGVPVEELVFHKTGIGDIETEPQP